MPKSRTSASNVLTGPRDSGQADHDVPRAGADLAGFGPRGYLPSEAMFFTLAESTLSAVSSVLVRLARSQSVGEQ
jgi:hypothetical protein